jgi:hypothetical protein
MRRRFRDTCKTIASGESTSKAAKKHGWKTGQFYRYMAKHPEYRPEYTLAKEVGSDALMDQTLDIADSPDTEPGSIARDALRIKTRQVAVKSWAPQVYGDKLSQSISGKLENVQPVLNVSLTPFDRLGDAASQTNAALPDKSD